MSSNNQQVIGNGDYTALSSYKKEPVEDKRINGTSNNEFSRPDSEQRYLSDVIYKQENRVHVLNKRTELKPHETLLNKASDAEEGNNVEFLVSKEISNP